MGTSTRRPFLRRVSAVAGGYAPPVAKPAQNDPATC